MRAVISTSTLDIAYRDEGSSSDPVVLARHGWPDVVSTSDQVVPGSEQAGFRVIAPSMRGFGATTFRSEDTSRTGNTC